MSIQIIQSPPPISAVRNDIHMAIQADAGWSGFDRYWIDAVIEVEVGYRTNRTEDLTTIVCRPMSDGLCELNLGQPKGILSAILQADPPDLTAAGYVHKLNVKRYRVRLEEYQDGVLAHTVTTGWHSVASAGSDELQGQNYTGFAFQRKLLSRRPAPRRVLLWEPAFISFIAPSSGNVTMSAEVTRDDGTVITASLNSFSLYAFALDLFTINVCPDFLGISSITGAVSYIITVVVNGIPMADRPEFVLETFAGKPLDRFFIFQNSLGAYECLRTQGEAKIKRSISSTTALRARQRSAPRGQAQKVRQVTGIERGARQRTSLLTRAELLWLEEFLASEDTYRWGAELPNITGDGDLVPIVLEDYDDDIIEDLVFPADLTFAYQDAYIHRGS